MRPVVGLGLAWHLARLVDKHAQTVRVGVTAASILEVGLVRLNLGGVLYCVQAHSRRARLRRRACCSCCAAEVWAAQALR